MAGAVIRFVQGNEASSKLIVLREGSASPFTPSHVELKVATGYLGAMLQGGVAIRPVGYDKGTIAGEFFVTVPCDAAKVEAYARSKLGTPYDWKAIVDFVVPLGWNQPDDFICSSLMALALMVGGAFAGSLCVPSWQISPRDLLLTLSAITKIGV